MAKQFKFGFVIEGDAERGTKVLRKFKEEVAGVEKNTQSARQRTREWKKDTDEANGSIANATKLVKGMSAAIAAYGGYKLAATVVNDYRELELGLVGVAKTTGLAGEELDRFKARINQISRETPVTTNELLELAQSAGQMGVTGADNLEKFALTIAKMGRASDLAGEQAAKSLARILNVTGENISEIDVLASVIVSLGNNVAATESEIARMTTEVARSTSAFGVNSAEAAALAAAMAAIGIQAQAGGSAVGRTMQVITDTVQAGGDELAYFADVLGLNADELARLFSENKTEAFRYFLGSVGELGLGAGNALKEVGLGGQEIAKSIIPLANNLDILEETLGLANAEVQNATALNEEWEAALGTLDAQLLQAQNILKGYRLELAEQFVPQVNEALKAFNNWAEADGPEKALNATTRAAQLLTIALGARLLGPLAQATVATGAAAVRSLAYSGALTGVERSLILATAQQRLFNAAVSKGRAALALVGGPAGAVMLAAGAVYAFREELGLLPFDAEKAQAAIDSLVGSIENMNQVQLDQRRWVHTDGLRDAQEEVTKLTRNIASLENSLARTAAGGGQFFSVEHRERRLANLRLELQEVSAAAAGHAEALALIDEAMERLANPIAHVVDEVEDVTGAVEENNEVLEEATGRTNELTGKIEQQIQSYRQREAALALNSRNQAIYNALMQATALATAEQTRLTNDEIDQIVRHAGAVYDREQALREEAESLKGNVKETKRLSDESDRMHKQMQKDWNETRREFGSFFADLVQNGESAFDALLKSWERMLLEMVGQLALSGVLKVFDINVPGSSAAGLQGVLDSSGIAGAVTGSLIDRFGATAAANSGIADIVAAFSGPLAGPVRPGETLGGFNGALLAGGLKTLGLSIGAGFAGDLAGGALGEALFGKEAQSAIGSSIGGTIGASIGGPVGAFIGSSLGAMVDVATGGDGKLRQNAGMLVAPTPGMDPSRTFSVDPFTSGLRVTGVARRADQASATQVIDTFREVDSVVAALIQELDGTLDLTRATLDGLDEEATQGSLGTFLGLGGNGQLAGDLMSQLDNFVDQLLAHTSGLSEELIETARAADSAEGAIAVLAAAVIDQGAAAEEAARVLEESARAAEESARATEELRRVEERLLMYRVDAIAQIASELQAAATVQNSIQMSIYEALGATPLREFDQTVEGQIARIADHRSILVQQHQEQMRAELALHNQRLAYARSLNDYAMSLRLGEMSNLSPAEQLELAKSTFQQLAAAAESGDLQAIGQLQTAADQYIAAADEMWASSTPRQNAVNEVLSVMDRLSLTLSTSEFDPTAANEALVNQLEELNRQTEQISVTLNESIIAELSNISVVLSELGPQVQGSLISAVSHWVESSGPGALEIIASLGGIQGSVDDLPRGISLYLSDVMGVWISSQLEKGTRPEIIADQISRGGLDESAANMYLEKNKQGKVDDYRSPHNPDIAAQDIAEHVSQVISNSKTEEEAVRRIYEDAQSAGVGSKQLADAIGIAQQEVIDLTERYATPPSAYNDQLTPQEIRDHVAHVNSISATEEEAVKRIYADALAAGVGSKQLADALGDSQQTIIDLAARFGLPSFSGGGIARGPASGYLSVLHDTEAVIPLPDGRSVPVRMEGSANDALLSEVRALRAEVGELKRTTQNVGLDAARQRDEQKRIAVSTQDDIARLVPRRVSGNLG